MIAATNSPLDKRDPRRQISRGSVYRLNVFPIPLPPLRDRKEDLPVLTSGAAGRSESEARNQGHRFSRDVEERLRAYNWPGNVRELRNVLERAVILAG